MTERVPTLIWHNGVTTAWEDARVHVWTEVVQRGISVFEGIRGYWSSSDQRHYLLHLDAHLDRLRQSCRIARIMQPYSSEALRQAIGELIVALAYREHLYIRPTIYLDYGGPGTPPQEQRVGCFVAVLPVPRLDTVAAGLRCHISTWRRPHDTALPARVKAGANYFSMRLARLEATFLGFDEAILLNHSGTVAETPGAAIFIVRNGTVATPRCTDGILESLTRAAICTLLKTEFSARVQEREIDRTELYSADEIFAAGTLNEVTPVVRVDDIVVDSLAPGALSVQVRDRYIELCEAGGHDPYGWLTPGPEILTTPLDRA